MKHFSSYLYHIQASHSTITSYKQQGRENEWQRMGVEKTKKKDSKDLAQSTSITARPERQVQTAKHPLKRAAGTAEGETTIRNMLRDTFLPDIVFL